LLKEVILKRLSDLNLSHKEFFGKVISGQLSVRVNKAAAGNLFTGPLAQYAAHQAFLRFATFSLIASGVVLFFFTPWYYAIAFILLGFFFASRAQRHAALALETEIISNESFYMAMMDNDVDIVRLEENEGK
jgi:hypothetical protein